MARFRFAILLLIGSAFLAAPLSALCSSCCVPESGLSAPMPCCSGGTCGSTWTAARPGDPAIASAKTKLDPPLLTAELPPQAIDRTLVTGVLAVTLPAVATESPPVSTSVLRL
jgi:hypothetical protein